MARLLAFGSVVFAVVQLAACRERPDPEASAARTPAAPALSKPENADAQTGGRPGESLALPTDTRDVEGIVARASAGEIVVRPTGEEGTPVTLKVPSGTPVLLDGRPSSAEKIPEGAQVRASYASDAGESRAIRVEANHEQKKSGPGGANPQGRE